MKMQLKWMLVVLAIAMAFPVIPSAAAPAKKSPQAVLQELAALGPGVYRIKHDAQGRLQSCLVIGQARVSSALGAAKGNMVAQRRAMQDAKGQFVKWTRTNVRAIEMSGDIASVTLQSKTGANGKDVSEEAEATEALVSVTESDAQGMVRGLRIVGKDQDAKTKILTVAYAWKPNFARDAASVEAGMDVSARDLSDEPPAADAAPAGAVAPDKGTSTTLVSDDAEGVF